MIVTSVRGSIPTKYVRVEGITSETTDEIVAAAMAAARETRSSLFGWGVRRLEGGAADVALHTD